MSTTKVVPVTLYHGTDKKILDYSDMERSDIQKLCVEVSDTVYHS